MSPQRTGHDLPASISVAEAAANRVPLGRHSTGSLELDLDRLLAGRLLIQGSSGAGKSRTLRRIIEEAFDYTTVAIVDPEGNSKISHGISARPRSARSN